MVNKNGHWYTDKNGHHYFVEDGQSPKEGWEASKRRKMIDGGKYKVSDDGNTYNEVSKDEYDKFEADDADWDINNDDDFGFDEEEEQQRYREAEYAMDGEEDEDEEVEEESAVAKETWPPQDLKQYMKKTDNGYSFDMNVLKDKSVEELSMLLEHPDAQNNLVIKNAVMSAIYQKNREEPEYKNGFNQIINQPEGSGPHRMADIAIDEDEDAVDPKKHNTTSNQNANPQIARKTKYPTFEEHNVTPEQKEALRKLEHYTSFDGSKGADEAIARTKKYMEKNKGKSYWDAEDEKRYNDEIALLSDPNVRAYLVARKEYNDQFDKDFNEYLPGAEKRILEKILDDKDYYSTRKYNKEKDDFDETDDLYDEITDDFHNKYGYETRYHGAHFSPLRDRIGTYHGEEEKLEDGTRRSKYNKEEMISDLLRSGKLTFADLKKMIKGK